MYEESDDASKDYLYFLDEPQDESHHDHVHTKNHNKIISMQPNKPSMLNRVTLTTETNIHSSDNIFGENEKEPSVNSFEIIRDLEKMM